MSDFPSVPSCPVTPHPVTSLVPHPHPDTVSPLMPEPSRATVSPPLAALATWVVPGGGYWLLGQRGRALTVGITVVTLFVLGLLIGGVRALEVPGWDEGGNQVRLVFDTSTAGKREWVKVRPDQEPHYSRGTWVMRRNPLSELRTKPWFIAQVLAGPVALVSGAGSVWASSDPDGPDGDARARGVTSHGRVNEIGVLYTAVAGMLNLLAIIDASHRASHPHARRPGPRRPDVHQPAAQGLGANRPEALS